MKSFHVKIGIGVVLALGVGIALCVVLDWRPGDSSWEVGRSIGTFATRDAAVSASLKRLSQVIRRHPTTEQYRIYFDLSTRDEHGGGGATFYVRKSTPQLGRIHTSLATGGFRTLSETWCANDALMRFPSPFNGEKDYG